MGLFKKIIAGGLGWTLGGPIGAIIGVVFASLFDSDKSFEYQRVEDAGRTHKSNRGGNDFQVVLLVLMSAVVKADGRVVKEELSVVKRFLIQNYGEEGAREAWQILNQLLKQNIDVAEVATQCGLNLNYSVRLQLLNMLFSVAAGDGEVVDAEVAVINTIARYMRISDADLASIAAMFIKRSNPDWAYQVLELSSDCSNEEIKKAYRRMAMKYHPDKVNSLGEEVKQSATEKFRKVKEAYDYLKQQRGF
ncbi:MAG: TerB family tellurite resistance protein [Paludibacteraceae bacterium]|nr:TerB family tellurite resistance protein [Paludibacteraceae bacterium]MBR6520828.1 TerB family tellurite resistance protein [Paludibacteraceae bacterium]